jgi:hypothetical protein
MGDGSASRTSSRSITALPIKPLDSMIERELDSSWIHGYPRLRPTSTALPNPKNGRNAIAAPFLALAPSHIHVLVHAEAATTRSSVF